MVGDAPCISSASAGGADLADPRPHRRPRARGRSRRIHAATELLAPCHKARARRRRSRARPEAVSPPSAPVFLNVAPASDTRSRTSPRS